MTTIVKKAKRARKTARRLIARTADVCHLAAGKSRALMDLWLGGSASERHDIKKFCHARIAKAEAVIADAVRVRSSKLAVGPDDVRRVALGDVSVYQPRPTLLSA